MTEHASPTVDSRTFRAEDLSDGEVKEFLEIYRHIFQENRQFY